MSQPGEYLRGFGGFFESEAIEGALPARQNSPRRVRFGLYAEQLNGTSFGAPRADNQRTWTYRIRPSCVEGAWEPVASALASDHLERPPDPNLRGWRPGSLELDHPTDFVDGLRPLGGSGDPADRRGFAVYRYLANADMERRALASVDGDLMILPDTGELAVTTELGRLTAAPGQLVVIPRGLRFAIATGGRVVRGYAGEVFGVHFGLPERGIVGANGLVDPRHVEYPRAAFVDDDAEHRLSLKVGGRLWEARRPGSPFDVVAWHGNYAPFRYDLANFSPVGAVAFDHPDPSIFSVFTAPLDRPGESTLDLVIFPPRWDVTENTFRPPFYHRNAATELNGILTGPSRDAVFSRGGAFLTPPMAGHGIAPAALERALAASDADADRPRRAGADGLWFQLESTLPMRLSSWALDSPALDPDFGAAPRKTPRRFRP